MADEQISDRIERLVQEEHDLLHKAEDRGGLDDDEHQRMQVVQVELDQCYDLLRRRRARRSAGQDPDQEQVRPESTVENYLQ